MSLTRPDLNKFFRIYCCVIRLFVLFLLLLWICSSSATPRSLPNAASKRTTSCSIRSRLSSTDNIAGKFLFKHVVVFLLLVPARFALMVSNFYLAVCKSLRCQSVDPTIRQPGFDLPRQQWSLLNRFRTEQGHCGACRRKWRFTDTDLCPCSETQTMSHIVKSCPLTKLKHPVFYASKKLTPREHSAYEDAVLWLTSYGPWHAYEKKKKSVEHIIVACLLQLFLEHLYFSCVL